MKESNGQICAICSIKMGVKQAGERIQDFSHTFLCREVDFAKLLARRFF